MNYKILVTEENRLAIKDIAERNGMNKKYKWNFDSYDPYYFIHKCKFIFDPEESQKSNYQELTFDQFKEMFDNKMENKELETWLKETKAKNLTEMQIYELLDSEYNVSEKDYLALKRIFKVENQTDLSKALFSQWQKEIDLKEVKIDLNGFPQSTIDHFTKNNPNMGDNSNLANQDENRFIAFKEAEFSPKRGDRVLVWNSNSSGAIERNYFDKTDKSILALDRQEYQDFLDNKDFVLEQYDNMKPLPTEQPTETDYKTKVIELIRDRIVIANNNLYDAVQNKLYDDAAIFQKDSQKLVELLNEIIKLC